MRSEGGPSAPGAEAGRGGVAGGLCQVTSSPPWEPSAGLFAVTLESRRSGPAQQAAVGRGCPHPQGPLSPC